MKRLPFFKFDTSAWRTGKIRFMTPEEQGVFITLCCLIWDGNGEYEIDDFSHRHCNTGQPLFNQHVQALTAVNLLVNHDGVLSVRFISEQLSSYDEYREKQAEKGRKSAEARRKKEPLSTNKREERREKKEDSRENKNKRQTKRAQHDAAVFAFALPEKYSVQFAEAWQEFCDHRADLSAWLTERALKLLLKTLDPLSEQAAITALNKSVANGWKGVFPEKGFGSTTVQTGEQEYGL
ncbi:unnamed protein product [marine sediment metagenome]|uniref:DUF1376 domain-containing protein n=1 Tax=marine sediment metagenome TaxID=412755 RepID=X1A094_9ZZZZ